jgi:ABC-2 type transport system ATP-binding protein
MNSPVITCSGVTKIFGKTEVLKGVDLEIPHGSIVGLLGTNGAGKSTLIKCLLGLLKISSGTATVCGEDPWDLSAETKNQLGYVPQDIKLYPWMRTSQVIDYTGAFYKDWDAEYCQMLMELWGLDGSSWIKTLSGGQLQRLAIILALGHKPSLLILDEPAASLDPVGRRSFLKSLLERDAEGEQTVLFSTHITSDLERVASHVALLENGRIGFFGELEELKDRVASNLEDIFLEMNRTSGQQSTERQNA